ncbi:MAG: riboflavin synthase [Spirochaetes bacterium]|nr:riboflavin synthase [Spirochaetota bacterium]
MFTGIIEECAKVSSIVSSGSGINIAINSSVVTSSLNNGDSVALNGVCQTVTKHSENYFEVFASRVTLSLTTLGKLKTGDNINLERAMLANSRFGGHMVSGHADGTGIITGLVSDASGLSVSVSVPNDLISMMIPKGSVAVDGISLTIVSISGNEFHLYIIPETMKNTNIPSWKTGSIVNIETDIIGKYVKKFIGADKSKSLEESLKENGFL